MRIKIKYIAFFIFFLLIFELFIWIYLLGWESIIKVIQIEGEVQRIENLYRIEKIEVVPDSTYGILMEQAEVDPNVSSAIFQAAEEVYDLSKVRVGRTLDMYYEKPTNELVKLVYQIDSEEELMVTYHVSRNTYQGDATSSSLGVVGGEWAAERVSIPYDIRLKISDGVVATSLYQAALDNNIDIRAIIELANAYQWTIDFAMDPRVGDTFKFIYEERYRNGEYVMPGRILAAKYINAGVDHRIYYFEESVDNKGYFDIEGNSVQKMFLKAPIQYKYITSGFTNGLRCLEAWGLCTGHKAIDYAAAYGTPIRAVGDGTVTFAGWSSVGYGNLTSIHHNGTYSTNYAHQSKIIVRYGQKVKQGEIIGYVGSTGFSTGPHLHYEMVKNGTKVNPLKEVLPPGKPIKEENKARYFEEIKKYQKVLK